MTRILVLYYSARGHIEVMAQAIAQGARSTGADVVLKRVPEIGAEKPLSDDYAQPEELADYDGILFGSPTHFGNMSAPMRYFLDQTSKLWLANKLVGKVGSVFNSTAAQHGGQESMILSFHASLLHHGMVIVGLPYTCEQQLTLDEISGGTPYGASTIAGGDGSRAVSELEQQMAYFQGRHVAEIAAKLAA